MSNDLVYNDQLISQKKEMLNLTDMWRAAGGDPNKKPVVWMRQDATVQFIEYVGENLKVIQDHLVKTVRGGRKPGSSWVHLYPIWNA